MWTGFPAAQAAVSGDVIVGLLGGTANQRFTAESWLFAANNLSDVANKTTSFDNLSPLSTKGDTLFYNGSGHNDRLPIGTTGEILTVVSGLPAWVANPGLLIANNLSDLNNATTARTNIGLGTTSTVGFGITTATTSTASATPGTIRALIGSVTGSNTTMTSGNLVGARGVATVVGASGGFIYGAQGKVVSTGTLSGSSWTAGVFGQFDLSAATVNGGQTAAIWGDYGTSVGTVTSAVGARGIAMTNTTGMKLNAQDYRYGDATYLMELASSGTPTYYAAAGTSAGSAGNSSHCAAQQVLALVINGTAVYIPVFTQNT
jgi:hypothetical protein